MLVYPTGIPTGSAGYTIEGSGSFNGTDGKLTRTISSAGNKKTFILEVIYKRGGTASSYLTAFSSGTDTFYWYLSSDQVYIQDYLHPNNRIELKSDAKLRDFSAWYHVIVAVDTTQATDTNRVKAWVNGVELTWAVTTYPTQNLDTKWNTGSQEHQIGHSSTTYSPDYFARAASYDGQTMTDPVTDGFGEFDENGVWVPLDVSGKTFGTTGFLIEGGAAFTNGTDSSGNSQNFTKGGTITNVNDTLTDKASDNFGNYPVWNLTHSSIDHSTSVIDSVTEGNLRATVTSNNSSTIFSTMASPASGKYMIRFVNKDASNNSNILVGLQDTSQAMPAYNSGAGIASSGQRSVVYRFGGGYLYINGTNSHQYTTGASADNTLDLAWDADTGKVWIAVNGTWQDGEGNTGGGSTDIAGAGTGNVATLTSGYQYAIAVSMWDTTSVLIDQDGGTLPTGFKRFNTANLPAPTVTKPDDFFKTLLYTGNGSTLAVTGAGFQPDFVWLKCRSVATNWNVVDVVRGADAMLRMASSLNTEQSGGSQEFESFDADGFTVIDHTGVVEELNRSGATYVGYCMKAGGSASSNGNGSITSSVSAASHGGFSIGTFTTGTNGAITIGHGLSRAPDIVIVKDRESSGQYWTYLGPEGAGKYVALNSDGASASSTAVWNNTAPTSSVFSTQDNGAWLTAGNDHVFYAFAKTPGLIGIGSYTGNGSSDGPMVIVDDGASGFKPAWLMIKSTASGNWNIVDAVRDPFNPMSDGLRANATTAEFSGQAMDFIANGFKLRLSGADYNTSSQSYIYLAFAENPFGGETIAQARAR